MLDGRDKLLQLTLVSGITLALMGCDSGNKVEVVEQVVRPVKLYTLSDDRMTELKQFPAQIRASKESIMSFRVPGQLVELPVIAAQEVKAGQMLARLDDRDFITEVALRKTDYELAKANFDRISKLTEQQVLSQADFDNAKAAVESARSALRLAKDRLSDTKLQAPFTGRVAETMVENYEYVQPQQTVLVLQDQNNLEVSIQFPENLLARINEDTVNKAYQPLVKLTGNKDSFPVTYKEHATRATQGTQAYEVVFSFRAPEDGVTIYPGMGATVTMDMAQLTQSAGGEQEFLVPVTAVLSDDASGKSQVWKYQDGGLLPIEVTLGDMTDRGLVVRGELKPGDQLVSAGLNKLRPDMKVKPLERERGL